MSGRAAVLPRAARFPDIEGKRQTPARAHDVAYKRHRAGLRVAEQNGFRVAVQPGRDFDQIQRGTDHFKFTLPIEMLDETTEAEAVDIVGIDEFPYGMRADASICGAIGSPAMILINRTID